MFIYNTPPTRKGNPMSAFRFPRNTVVLYGIFLNAHCERDLLAYGAVPVSVARVSGMYLSNDGLYSSQLGNPHDSFWGVAWRLNPRALAYLDRVEGVNYSNPRDGFYTAVRLHSEWKKRGGAFTYKMNRRQPFRASHNNKERAQRSAHRLGLNPGCILPFTAYPDKAPDDGARRLYFAYGSNLSEKRITHRCPSAQKVAVVGLLGYALRFASGFCNYEQEEGSVLPGVVWSLSPADWRKLDRVEGLYSCVKADLTIGGEQVYTYQMTSRNRSRNATPVAQRYYNIVERNYKRNGLPLEILQRAAIGVRFVDTSPPPRYKPPSFWRKHPQPRLSWNGDRGGWGGGGNTYHYTNPHPSPITDGALDNWLKAHGGK